MSALTPDRTLLHFRIERRLGRGGMGEVYRAFDTKLGRPVALKLLPEGTVPDLRASRRFREEARLASALNHPHIVTVYSIEEAEGHEFIVMELVEGETLQERAQRGPIPFPDLIELSIQVAEGLAAAHAIGLVHRDVKPANILVTPEGRAKVADFGLAKRLLAPAAGTDPGVTVEVLTGIGTVVGTPSYMSPEQTRGEPLDARSDLFSLGVTLYEAATGRLPFQGPSALAVMHAIATTEPDPVRRLRPDAPPEFDLVLARAMKKDPGERWAAARDFADALRGLREGAALTTAVVTLPQASASKVPNNIPAQLTSFIGRRRERAEVRRLFTASRLVTILGAGGTGKTRLAIQVASDMLPEQLDGVWVVELATLQDPALVPQTAAAALGVREEAGRPLVAGLGEAIGPSSMLLVLDNCEHLAAASAAFAEALMRVCPNLRILVTSQEGLGVPGELIWRIPTLSVPDMPRGAPTSMDAVGRYEGVRLFLERAAVAQPSFSLTRANASAVAQICHRLDGIPLAIELAAVRVKVLPVEKILARLEDRFHLLTGGSRTALPRQQTLRAAMDWSYELLSPLERTLLNRLGIFAGGCTLEEAEEICAWGEVRVDDVLELLSHLVDKSLVGARESADGGMRYILLETIRAYAFERAAESGETADLTARHAACFVKLSEAVEPRLVGRQQAVWLDLLEEEHGNLRQALQGLVNRRDADSALRLAGALWRFWWIRGNWTEGRAHLAAALRLESAEPRSLARSKALRAKAVLARGQGDFTTAGTLLNESLAIARERSDATGTAAALFELGNIANERVDLIEARRFYEECLAIRRSLDDPLGISMTLHNLAVVAEAGQDLEETTALYKEALALHRALGNRAMEANTLNGLGSVARAQDQPALARAHHEQALEIQRELKDQRGIAFSLRELGAIAAEQGDQSTACSRLAECMEILKTLGDRQGLAATMEAYAGAAAAAGQPERALRLAGAARSLRKAIDSPLSKPDEDLLDSKLAQARRTLGPERAGVALEDGERMGIDEAVRLAIEAGPDDDHRPVQP
jgi:predicted ATPase